MRKLHGPATSPFVRKVWIFLHEKGLEFEHRELDPLAKTPRFLAMNPLGRVPILEEGDGHLISDSSVICDYLERTQPLPALYPAEPRARARALWLEEYGDTLLTGVCARVFWMHVIIPVRSGKPIDPAEVARFEGESFPGAFDYLESVAPARGPFLGEAFGIADIALLSPVRLLDLAGAPLDGRRWPRFEAWYRRALERPCARSIDAAERAATEVFRSTGNAPPTSP
jgi:glutathione S-transferase